MSFACSGVNSISRSSRLQNTAASRYQFQALTLDCGPGSVKGRTNAAGHRDAAASFAARRAIHALRGDRLVDESRRLLHLWDRKPCFVDRRDAHQGADVHGYARRCQAGKEREGDFDRGARTG